ncbi:hypothetical protein D8666_01660 [Ochrobactrum soli]|nr:hypothetical protein D8666_01660 [[Ochrobactrum] soli]
MGEQGPEKQMASVAGGGATDAIWKDRIGRRRTGLVVAKPGRRMAWQQTRAGGRRIQSWWYSQRETSI